MRIEAVAVRARSRGRSKCWKSVDRWRRDILRVVLGMDRTI